MEENNDFLMEEADLAPEEPEMPEEAPQSEPSEAPEQPGSDREEEFVDFVRQYPGVDAKKIPPSVWQAMKRGDTLLNAYRSHELQQLRNDNLRLQRQVDTLQQQEQARSRSLGSVRSAGKASQTDGFLLGFDQA